MTTCAPGSLRASAIIAEASRTHGIPRLFAFSLLLHLFDLPSEVLVHAGHARCQPALHLPDARRLDDVLVLFRLGSDRAPHRLGDTHAPYVGEPLQGREVLLRQQHRPLDRVLLTRRSAHFSRSAHTFSIQKNVTSIKRKPVKIQRLSLYTEIGLPGSYPQRCSGGSNTKPWKRR